jgi:hypothetical protein
MNNDDEKKFLKNLFDFLDSDSGESLEELKENLKEEEIDFDIAKSRLQKTFSKLIQKRKTEIREQEKKQMVEERTIFQQFQNKQDLPKDKESKWKEINRIRAEYPELKLKFASRNYENISNEDLGKILIELRSLVNEDRPND